MIKSGFFLFNCFLVIRHRGRMDTDIFSHFSFFEKKKCFSRMFNHQSDLSRMIDNNMVTIKLSELH